MDEEEPEAWPASDWDDSSSSGDATSSGDEAPALLSSQADQESDAGDDADQTTGVDTSEVEETTSESTSKDDARDERWMARPMPRLLNLQQANRGPSRFALHRSSPFRAKRSLNFRSVNTVAAWSQRR